MKVTKTLKGKRGAKPSWVPFPDDETRLYNRKSGMRTRVQRVDGRRANVRVDMDIEYILRINKEYLYRHTMDKSCPAQLAARTITDLNTGLVPIGECVDHGRVITGRYAKFMINGVGCALHRVAFAAANGLVVTAMPEGAVIMHSCDNPRCVNPEHLYMGDKYLNAQDMILKGRAWTQNGGYRSPHGVKLSKQEVVGIYQMAHLGNKTHRQIAEEYNITTDHVAHIKNGKVWKSVIKGIKLKRRPKRQ